MRRATATLSACAIGAALAAGPARAQAPIVTDGTMGARVELNGPAMQIPNTLGTQAGKNLFHSFQRFNIPTRNSATFTGPGGIDNVVSRVTGGEASTIDGTFRSTIPGANVWFTNPAGVTFGPNASLDVPASFHASTANEIRFPDGGRFSADLGATSTLSVAPPEAFGFLSSNPAPLKVERSHLSTVTGATLSLAAGEIDIQGNAPTPDFNLPEFVDITGGTLRAPSGTINLASVAGPAEVKTDGTVSGNNHGAIRLTDGALVNASGDGAGVVRIRGGEVTSTGSYVLASNTGSVAGAGGIDISADRLSLQDDGRSPSLVAANAHNAGDAPPINVRARDITMKNSDIRSIAYGAGKAGNIPIDAANQMTLRACRSLPPSIVSIALPGSWRRRRTVIVHADHFAIEQCEYQRF